MKLTKLLILLLIASCGYSPMTTEIPLIVNEIETAIVMNECTCLCNYYGSNNKGYKRVATFADNKWKLTDTCGTFNIGDTIKFIK